MNIFDLKQRIERPCSVLYGSILYPPPPHVVYYSQHITALTELFTIYIAEGDAVRGHMRRIEQLTKGPTNRTTTNQQIQM